MLSSLYLISFYNSKLKEKITQEKIVFNKIPAFTPFPYPLISNVLSTNDSKSELEFTYASSEKIESPEISSEGAIIMDNDSKVILYAKNEKLRFSMASTTKIMTALVALDYFKMDDILTVKTENVDGAVVGFSEGERIYFKDMLYAMLLPSGNDVALAIAENYKGGKELFIKKMNEKAIQLNLYNTHFSDSTGLFDDGDYTTVFDLAHLSSIAMENKIIQEIVGTKNKVISTVDGKNKYVLNNLNKLLGFYGVEGIKTGFTEEAGGILATSKIEYGENKEEHRLIIVVMKSQDRFEDTKKLLSFINGKVKYLDLSSN